jgi:hypothetical protein
MGISSKAAQWLFEYAREKPFSGSVLELGVQWQSFNYQRMAEVAKVAHYQSAELESVLSESNPSAIVEDRPLFKAMGFSEVIRTDYDAFEGADFTFDLNAANGPPEAWRRYFDCIIDAGTMEHVFHTPNALENIFELLKVGGKIVHMSPTNNYVDHGFYSFSPTFFCDYYAENGFEIERCTLVQHTRDVEGTPWVLGEYGPRQLDHVQFGGLNDKLYVTFFIAMKTAASTFGRCPQQSTYKAAWAAGNQDSQHAAVHERRQLLDAKAQRPAWLQARFDILAIQSERLSMWLRKPSERRDFPLDNWKLY